MGPRLRETVNRSGTICRELLIIWLNLGLAC